MTFHFLFEQSGVFKNVLKNEGYLAFDYDISNTYGQTDFQIDLFQEIEKEYINQTVGFEQKTIFTAMRPENDFILAFFPCTHFCEANALIYKLWNRGGKLQFDYKNCNKLILRNQERAKYFEIYLKFCFICKQMGIPTIIENPASFGKSNFLVNYSPIDVGFYEKDRSLFGDYFKKPTNFFSINFDMKENFTLFQKNIYTRRVESANGMLERSLMSVDYAYNFYKRFLSNFLKGGTNGSICNQKM